MESGGGVQTGHIFLILSAVFLLLALVRVVRLGASLDAQSRTHALVGAIFGVVTWLLLRS